MLESYGDEAAENQRRWPGRYNKRRANIFFVMSDSQFVFGRDARRQDDDDGWEKETLQPDDLEFPTEIEAQLAVVLSLDESDFDLSDSNTTTTPGMVRKTDSRAQCNADEVWEDLGLEDFILGVQREQKLAASHRNPSHAGDDEEEEGEEAPSSFISQ